MFFSFLHRFAVKTNIKVGTYIELAEPPKIEIGRRYQLNGIGLFLPGLPDFSRQYLPKRGKIYQINNKYML
jgi:hypothetical protein